jgi:alkanesulfonate monooxygenase SsuD/methylene tetrahydromethanopterin reductase-like flavin-dependent oxidoreductase (luciferase family)
MIVERWNGLAFDRPLERMRDMARFLRRSLRGEKVTEEFDTFAIRGFQLDRPPETPPPILFAALRAGMLRLAEAEADGAIVNWFSAADAGRAAEIVRGRDDGKELAARIMVAPTEDTELVYATVRRLFTAYLTVPAYVASQQWLGREPALGPMWEAWASGDRKAALRLVPDDVIDALVVHGSYEQCRQGLAEYVDHGVTTPVLAVLPIGPSIDEALAGLAPGAG